MSTQQGRSETAEGYFASSGLSFAAAIRSGRVRSRGRLMRPTDVSSVRVTIVPVLVVATALVATGCDSIAVPTQATSAALAKAVADRRLMAALRIYAALEKPDGDDEFLVGRALMDLCRPGDAVAHLS